jgi:hypothetical protein
MENQMELELDLELELKGLASDDLEKESYQIEGYEIASQKPTSISLWVRFCDFTEDFN